MPDHHARATRLRDFIDSLSKVNDDLAEADVDLDGEIPNVPCRYAVSEWDGSSTSINFADTIEDANAIAADLGGGDYPWAPGEMMDLDTGVPYEPNVTVEFVAQRWLVHASPDDSDLVFNVRFTSEKQAREYIATHEDPESGMTVLDGEPIDTLPREDAEQ
jgi:hypothetical protein